jgi:hypothetical protein
MKYYAGIGSRETPTQMLKDMTTFATLLRLGGYTLRSGAAPGADAATGVAPNEYRSGIEGTHCVLDITREGEEYIVHF